MIHRGRTHFLYSLQQAKRVWYFADSWSHNIWSKKDFADQKNLFPSCHWFESNRVKSRLTVPSWYIAVPLKLLNLKAFLMAELARPMRRLSAANVGHPEIFQAVSRPQKISMSISLWWRQPAWTLSNSAQVETIAPTVARGYNKWFCLKMGRARDHSCTMLHIVAIVCAFATPVSDNFSKKTAVCCEELNTNSNTNIALHSWTLPLAFSFSVYPSDIFWPLLNTNKSKNANNIRDKETQSTTDINRPSVPRHCVF